MDSTPTYGFSRFADLVHTLGSINGTNAKLHILSDYVRTATPADKIWVIGIFSGRRPRRMLRTSLLREWCMQLSQMQEWLFSECYHTVGDLAETIALLVPDSDDHVKNDISLATIMQELIELSELPESKQQVCVQTNWLQMGRAERYVYNKLITGNFRIGVSQQLMVQALAQHMQESPSVIAHRISGKWDPRTTSWEQLFDPAQASNDPSRPYPFYLAYPLEDQPQSLGDPTEWQAEWKWDGIRGQIIKRENQLFIWSRGEELMTDKFPELQAFAEQLPEGTVLDGEILCMQVQNETWHPLPFARLQTRIGRKNVSKKQLLDAPAGFVAYDLLEYAGTDWRQKSLQERRMKLEEVITAAAHPKLQVSPTLQTADWLQLTEMRELARENGSEGLMLKRKGSVYQTGRKRGDWYKWKIDPLTIDAVMIYAQKGHGRRSNLYTDYTFAVRDGDKLIPFAKAYSGLTDKEFAEVDAFVRKNALEKFGPVRTITPALVFEVAFEGIAASGRHKSGVALRFPRISRWRKDKPLSEINTLDDLRRMLDLYGK